EVPGGVRRAVAAAAGLVLVVAGRRVDLGLEPAPRRVERRLERAEAAAAVLVVAEGEHRRDRGVVLDDVRRRHLLAGRRGALPTVEAGGGRIAGDVAGCGDDGV